MTAELRYPLLRQGGSLRYPVEIMLNDFPLHSVQFYTYLIP